MLEKGFLSFVLLWGVDGGYVVLFYFFEQVPDCPGRPAPAERPKLQMLTNKKILEFHPKFKFVLQFSIYIGIIVTNYAF